MRKLKKPIKQALIALGVISLAAYCTWYTNDIEIRSTEVKTSYEPRLLMLDLEDEIPSTDIIITNYYLGDGSSGTTTVSGYQISDFGVNDEGMYTLMDFIVIATANTTRLERPLNEGYKSHELYEVLKLRFNGKEYTGIVLDVCGSCFGVEGEDLQRYDVFTTGGVIGKVQGKLYEEESE